MTERQLQFRVGIFVILAMSAIGAMVFQFGELKTILEPRYGFTVHFDSVTGIHPSTLVTKNGIEIGSVSDVKFDEQNGGVLVDVEVRQDVLLREDCQLRVVRSLLGGAGLEIVEGVSDQLLQPGTVREGVQAPGPMETVNRLEEKMNQTVDAFNTTSREWNNVAKNLNSLLETNNGNLNLVIERAAESLEQFSLAMKSANESFSQASQLIGNREYQENLRKTLEAMPRLVSETEQTILAVRRSVQKVDQNLDNLNNATRPLAEKSTSIVTRLDRTMGNLESLSREMSDFARLVAREDGSLQRFASDPQLYHNVNRSAESLTVLLKNLEPILRDVRIFSDKVARHPELIGVSGVLNGSSGLKNPPSDEGRPNNSERIRQAGFNTRKPGKRE